MQIEDYLNTFSGQVVRFYADVDCRQQVCVCLLDDPAFEVEDDFATCNGLTPVGNAPIAARITHARAYSKDAQVLPPIGAFAVGGPDDNHMIRLEKTEIEQGGNVTLEAWRMPLSAGVINSRIMGHARVIKKADKDAAFAEARKALPDAIVDDSIRALTEHGQTAAYTIDALTEALSESE